MFSVVMPVYNTASSYLIEAVESVVAQDFDGFELIIVDDGSDAQCLSCIRPYIKRDSRVKLISQRNGGPGIAMNTGIQNAQGDWIVVMHSDDVMERNRLQKIAQYIENYDERIGIITAGVRLIAYDGRFLGQAFPTLNNNPYFFDDDDKNCIIGGLYHVAISRKVLEKVGGYSDMCRLNEDVELYNRIVEHGFGIKCLDEILMRYRIHGEAASSAKARELLRHWRYLKLCIRKRRSGHAIPDWGDYKLDMQSRGLLTKCREFIKDTGKIHYRAAATYYASRKRMKLLFHAMICCLCTPRYFYQKWQSRLMCS